MSSRKIHWMNHTIELVVVFLGITAGFILQNMREASGDRKLEQKYLQGFIADLDANIDHLKGQIEIDSTWLTENQDEMELILEEKLTKDKADTMLIRASTFSRFSSRNITYLNIVNSGNLGILRNYELRQELVAYYQGLEELNLIEDYIEKFAQETFLPYYLKHYDMFKREFSPPDLYRTTEFTNTIGFFTVFYAQRLDEYRRQLEASLHLHKHLEAHLRH